MTLQSTFLYKLTIHALIRPTGTFSRWEKERLPYPPVRAHYPASAKLPSFPVRSP